MKVEFLPSLGSNFEGGGSFLLTARSFLLTVGLCYLRWSFCLRLKFGLVFLLTVEIWFGLFCLRWKSVWSFLLTVPLVQKIGFGLFYLRFLYRK